MEFAIIILKFDYDRCNEKRNCSIQANTSLFSDPCPGTMKYLEAQYHCVPGNF